ncbi:MAG: amidohydrolase family protein [Anaerolineales bacterium]
MIVEWNAHIFSSDRERYPFHPEATYVPDEERLLNDPFGVYLERLDALGIDRAVLVQPEPYGDDHSLILDCLACEETRVKATCLFYPRDPDAVSKMVDLVNAHPRIVALRFHAHRGKTAYLNSFEDSNVRALWERAGELGLVIELHIGPNYASQAGKAIEEYPDFPVLIDHMAEPQLGTPEEYEDVLALARFPNVTIKMSGLSHFSREPEPYLDTKPLVRRVAEAFGADRIAWSSGSPTIVDELLDHWSEEKRVRVKGDNLARLAGFAGE